MIVKFNYLPQQANSPTITNYNSQVGKKKRNAVLYSLTIKWNLYLMVSVTLLMVLVKLLSCSLSERLLVHHTGLLRGIV